MGGRRSCARNAGDRRYASMTAAGAGARSAWGRAYAPTSASRARARNAGDRRYASMTASEAGARSASAAASASTTASAASARTAAATPPTSPSRRQLVWPPPGRASSGHVPRPSRRVSSRHAALFPHTSTRLAQAHQGGRWQLAHPLQAGPHHQGAWCGSGRVPRPAVILRHSIQAGTT